jgi:class 3 adenylate cyclase
MALPRPYTAIFTDIVNSSAGGYRRHGNLGRAIRGIIGAAVDLSDLREKWIRADRGDGELILAPADVPAAWLLADFINRIRIGVRDYNHDKHPDHRLRVRVGIAHGDVVVNDGKPEGGDTIVIANRLMDSDAAREAMLAVPQAPVAVMISDAFYQRVVPAGELGLEPSMFVQVEAEVPGKGFSETSWLHLPGHQPPVIAGGVVGGYRTDPVASAPAAAPRSATGVPRTPAATTGSVPPASKIWSGAVTNYGQLVQGDHASLTGNLSFGDIGR